MNRTIRSAVLLGTLLSLCLLPNAAAGNLSDHIHVGPGGGVSYHTVGSCESSQEETANETMSREECQGYISFGNGVDVCTSRTVEERHNKTTGENETSFSASCIVGDGDPPTRSLPLGLRELFG